MKPQGSQWGVRASPGRLMSVALVLLLGLFTGAPRLSWAIGDATLTIDAPAQVEEGSQIPITLWAENVNNIGGYQAHMSFDESAVELAGVKRSDNDMGRFGRGIGLLQHEMANGADLGMYSCPSADCHLASSGFRAGSAWGKVKLATIYLAPTGVGAVEVRFDDMVFVDAAGKPVSLLADRSSVLVQVGNGGPRFAAPDAKPSLAGAVGGGVARSADVARDGLIDRGDLTETASGWLTSREDGATCGASSAAFDIDGDGCVTVADVQMVASQAFERQSPAFAADEAVWVVNSTADDEDANLNGTCATAKNVCTLRAAISEANARKGPDRITFAIAGSGVKTIQLASRLPSLNDVDGGTVIDGYTQTGAKPNTLAQGSNAQIKVELRGKGAVQGTGFDLLRLYSRDNVVRGLSFYNHRRGVWLSEGASNNIIAGNFIGTNATATYTPTSRYDEAIGAVAIDLGANNNLIGGTSPADRNVIGGSQADGISLKNDGTYYNKVMGNVIGLTPDGNRQLINYIHGIDMDMGVSFTQIGGNASGEGNTVGGNTRSGIEVSHGPGSGTSNNQVLGNYVGTNLAGTAVFSYTMNGSVGIHVEDGVDSNVVDGNVVGGSGEGGIQILGLSTGSNRISNNRVGVGVNGAAIPNLRFGIEVRDGPQRNTIGPGNIVANNPTGIQLSQKSSALTYGITITRNSIYGNGTGNGIELFAGSNESIKAPTISKATDLRITGTGCAGCFIEGFVASRGSGSGQGKVYAGSANVGSDGSFLMYLMNVKPGDYVTITQTDSRGNTSQFSKNVRTTKDNVPVPTFTPTATATSTASPTLQATSTHTPTSTSTSTPTSTPRPGSAGSTRVFMPLMNK